MGYSIACKDAGVDCDWTGREETKEQLMAAMAKHAKEVHSYTDEQLADPELAKQIDAVIKTF
jgi:predicted small metal-binding protein